jgi:transcription termination factor Rho
MTNKALTMNSFPHTEDDIAPGGATRSLDADQQGAISPALPALNDQEGSFPGSGVLDIPDGGFGFLRTERFLPGRGDTYISASQIRRFGRRRATWWVARFGLPRIAYSTPVCCALKA